MAKGLLLAMMEPPATIEEEFQDWYDSEHFPEREHCEGFETAHRFVCIDGWPRYLALYDLIDVDVLRGPAYAAIALGRYSPWTHRIMARAWGQFRAEGVQVYPGGALIGGRGAFTRVVVWRFRQVPRAGEAALIDGMRKLYEDRADTAQVRVFRTPGDDPCDYIALIELRGAAGAPEVALLGEAARYVDLVNTYVPYMRQAPGAFPKTT